MPEKPENELTEQARQNIEELKATIRQEVFSERKRQRRTQLIYAGLGIVIGVAVSAALFQWWGTIAKIQPLLVGVLVVAILAVAGAAVAFIWFRDSIFGKFFKAGVASYEVAVDNVAQNFTGLLTKLAPKLDPADLQNGVETLKKAGLQIAAYLAYLRARRMVMGWLVALAAGLAAFLGTTLLVRQNELLREQTALAKQQAHLTEAARRSSYVMLMDNILNQVNEELKGADTTPYHSSRRLSTVTIGRIAALSQSLRPIRYLVEGDTLSKYLSPERGQLLLALVYARLDTIHTYPAIYAKSNFSYADLERVNLDSVFLQKVNLRDANLAGTYLHKANLIGANLIGANLIGAKLIGANLSGVFLHGAYLGEAKLGNTDLSHAYLLYADLSGADLSHAYLFRADLSGVDLSHAYLFRADLSGANLSGAILNRADLKWANLSQAYLSGANLSRADLRRTNLKWAELESINIDSAKVISADFLDSLKYWQIENWEAITEKYRVDSIQSEVLPEIFSYLILPKNK